MITLHTLMMLIIMLNPLRSIVNYSLSIVNCHYDDEPTGNPLVTSIYTADPSARVFGDTLFVYPSHDEPTGKGFNMQDYHVFSTTDMKHFTDRGVIFRPFQQTTWAHQYAWAPYTYQGVILGPVSSGTNHHSIVEYHGQWYLFYHTSDLSLSRRLPEGRAPGLCRSICADSLFYRPDGTILPVVPTVNPERLKQ